MFASIGGRTAITLVRHGRARGFLVHCLLLVAALAGAPPGVTAATIASFDFDAPGGGLETTAESLHPGVTAGAWSDDAGTGRDYAGVTGRAFGARNWLSGNGFGLDITVAPGRTLLLDGIAWQQRASASGPSHWLLRVDGAIVGGDLIDTDFEPVSLTGLGLVLTGAVSLRLLGSGASSDAGTLRIDDVLLTGEVSAVPLPAMLPVFLAGTVVCAGAARRRRSG